jgi:hypothetical protein
MKRDNIEIDGHVGKWYIIDERWYCCSKIYLLEHQTYGDETYCLIVDENFDVILSNVYNGFKELKWFQ